jgi:hypothetical protein
MNITDEINITDEEREAYIDYCIARLELLLKQRRERELKEVSYV